MFGNNLPATLKANVLSVQGSIALAFLLFILLTSNPFVRFDPAPVDGQGLNPILQDPALAFHPPFLYCGYVGFSMAFSFAIASLIEGRTDAAWARWVRPWTLAAWMCLTIGIAMGSWWAYYELGWGGWWFWDPVENASFMPWLAGTALLHSALVMEKREALKVWTILLAILTFSLSLMGTFLVRSGVLSSVHAFAVDPGRGVFVLGIMLFFTGGGLTLFAYRARDLKQGGIFAPISREGGLVFNNVLLTTACATVLIGTLYPLALESITGEKISVGAPFFNMTFGPLMVPLLLAMPFGPFLAWKRGDLYAAAQRLAFAAVAALIAVAIGFAVTHRGPWLAPFGIAIGVWVMAGALSEIAFRTKVGQVPWAEAWRRVRSLPRSAYGTTLAHFGMGLTVVGIIATSAYQSERILVMKPGERVEIAGYELAFLGATPGKGPNYTELSGVFDVTRGGAKRDAARARETDLRCAAATDDGSRHPQLVARRSLRRARRSAGQRRLCRAALLPPVRALHLDRSADHVHRRRRVDLGSPAARRRADTGATGAVCRRAGRVSAMRELMGVRQTLRALVLAVALLGSATAALAVMPDELMSDPKLEARARHLSHGLRCLVCQNQSIDDSDAPLARDLRLLVRERIKSGDSDAQVIDFIVARYGDFVLLKPPLTWHTALLWATPFLLLVAALFAIWRNTTRSRADVGVALPPDALSEDERAKLEAALKERS